MFVIVNAARHLSVNAEVALNETADRFEKRFRYIEEQLRATGRSLKEADLQVMDRYWDEAKVREKEDDCGL